MDQLTTLLNDHYTVKLHPGQIRAHQSSARFVIVTAGTQSGKTSYGPYWLLREIQRGGPGDYLIVTPTFPLLERKLLGEFRALFEQQLGLGRYTTTPVRAFFFSPKGELELHGTRANPLTPTRVQFGYATDSNSLESMTIKAAWLDEAGQKKFKLESWQAILRRLSLSRGRVLVTTTVYALHWLKQLVDQAAHDATIEVIRFDSTANPAFAPAEFERARRDLPTWKFNMLYRGMFERPAGLIYDCVNDQIHRIPRFSIPRQWRRFVGVDFGSQNMAATFWALEPVHNANCVLRQGQCLKHDSSNDRLFCYRTYHGAGENAAGHVRKILHERGSLDEPALPYAVGGAASEDAWRREFAVAGLPVRPPTVTDVEVGIDRVYGAFQRNELFIFADLDELWDELTTYSRVLDAQNNPTDVIEDKAHYHLLDSVRYLISTLKGSSRQLQTARVDFYAPTSVPSEPHTQNAGRTPARTSRMEKLLHE